MRRQYIFLFLFCFWGITNGQTTRTMLFGEDKKDVPGEYVARDRIELLPGFEFTPTSDGEFKAWTDDGLLFSMDYLDEIPGQGIVTNESTVVGSTVGNADVSMTGAATYNIPISVVPGTAGLQPGLSIDYNSQSGNGLLGYKWSLSGISSIVRTGKAIYYDGVSQAPCLDDSDNFLFEGQRLLLTEGTHMQNNARYRTEMETFQDITLKKIDGKSCFEVKNREGYTLTYGTTDDSYIEAQGSTVPVSWLISRITDADGNYIEYKYTEKNSTGECYISEINYTGNTPAGLEPYAKVRFVYETREDTVSAYIFGKEICTTVLLKKIISTYKDEIFREYRLYYNRIDGYSRLATVEEYNRKGQSYNPIKIYWGIKEETLPINSDYYPHKYALMSHLLPPLAVADFDGDGAADMLLEGDTATADGRVARLHLSVKTVDNVSPLKEVGFMQIDDAVIPLGENYECLKVADLNGDGLCDVVRMNKKEIGGLRPTTYYYFTVFLFNGSSFVQSCEETLIGLDLSDAVIGDFSGNGINKILIKSWNGTGKLYGFDGNYSEYHGISDWGRRVESATMPRGFQYHYSYSYSGDVNSFDFTGAGKDNICVFDSAGISVYELVGNTFVKSLETSLVNADSDIYFGDYNGDGKMDVFDVNHGSSRILYSTGKNFKATSYDLSIPDVSMIYSLNFRHDKKSSIVAFKPGTQSADIYSFSNSGFSTVPKEFPMANYTFTGDQGLLIADFNGYGVPSFLLFGLQMEELHLYAFEAYFLRQAQYSDVCEIRDGFNNVNSFTYQRLKKNNSFDTNYDYVYQEDDATVNYPVNKRLYPITVVKTFKFAGPADESQSFSDSVLYRYKGIRNHSEGKGFLGFKEILEKRVTQSRTEITKAEIDGDNYYPYVSEKRITVNDSIPVETVIYENKKLALGGKRIFPYISKESKTDHLTTLTNETEYIFRQEDEGKPYIIKTKAGSLTTNQQYVWEMRGSRKVPVSITTTKSGLEGTYTDIKSFEYDSSGRLTRQIDNAGKQHAVTSRFSNYDKFGNAGTVTMSADSCPTVVVNRVYDPTGRFLLSEIKPSNHVTEKIYDEVTGEVLSEYSGGLTTQYEYDGFGRLSSVTDPKGNIRRTTWSWDNGLDPDKLHYKVVVNDPEKGVTTTWYDRYGREVQSESPNIGGLTKIKKEYDGQGRIKEITANRGDNYNKKISSIYEYDKFGRLSSVGYEMTDGSISTDLKHVSYSYSGLTTSMSEGKTKSVTLNKSGLVATSKDQSGDSISYSYNSLGLPVRIVSSGLTTDIVYDYRGYRTSVKDPNLTNPVSSEYNAYGWLTRQTNARGQSKRYVYDALGRVTQEQGPEATYSYRYVSSIEANGQLESVKKGNDLLMESVYDRYGQLTSMTETFEENKYQCKYGYDQFSRVSEYTSPSGMKLGYTYNEHGFLTSVKEKEGNAELWKLVSANENGEITESLFGNGLSRVSGFTAEGRLSTLQLKNGNSAIDSIYYNFSPSRERLLERSLSPEDVTEVFGYDALDRLTSVRKDDVLADSISYSPDGSITSKLNVGTYLYGMNNHAVSKIVNPVDGYMPPQFLSMEYNSSNRITGLMQDGDTVKKVRFTYGYDNQRRKMQYYENDALKRTRYYFGNYEKEVPATGNAKNIDYIYTPDGGVVVAEKTGNTARTYRYVHTDHLGSFRTVIGAGGAVLSRYSYDPWGVRSLESGTEAGLRGFTGHEHLDDFGLINMNARLYDPVLARFLGMDPYVQLPDYTQNFNRYGYCLNNPLMYTDASGEFIGWLG
ncbi:MAG: SpvB/TcaC N-terminal domain-containing protein, partial [Bacteroidales bacterium]|nr:SpvB/TcaC N-terminal domain-containing protein [Bacteroidales bacterium]